MRKSWFSPARHPLPELTQSQSAVPVRRPRLVTIPRAQLWSLSATLISRRPDLASESRGPGPRVPPSGQVFPAVSRVSPPPAVRWVGPARRRRRRSRRRRSIPGPAPCRPTRISREHVDTSRSPSQTKLFRPIGPPHNHKSIDAPPSGPPGGRAGETIPVNNAFLSKSQGATSAGAGLPRETDFYSYTSYFICSIILTNVLGNFNNVLT